MTYGTLEYWRNRAEALSHENADLRRKVDTAWDRIDLVYQHAADLGVELGEARLREHAVELRAIWYANETRADDLERFRREVVTNGMLTEDMLKAGADPRQLLDALIASTRKHNERAKARRHLAEARVRAQRTVDAALAAARPDAPESAA